MEGAATAQAAAAGARGPHPGVDASVGPRYAAMILAGRPVSNAELARFMNVSPGESSRRVKALDGVLRKERVGREVRISLPHYH